MIVSVFVRRLKPGASIGAVNLPRQRHAVPVRRTR